MKAKPDVLTFLGEAKEAEKAKDWKKAASLYEKILENAPAQQEAVSRLVIVYRKMKEHRKELAVIDAALAAYEQRGKDAQAKWIAEHPGAARAGRAVLQKLGGSGLSAFNVDPQVETLTKRRQFLTKRIGGKTAIRKKAPDKRKITRENARKQAAAAAIARKQAKMKQAAERKAALKEAAKQEAAEKEAKMHPSLFVITIRYLVSLEKIDAAMKAHIAWLDKYYDKGEFLASGRMVPRTGGVIIAVAKDRKNVERIVKTDPFIKKGLATTEITEFVASRIVKGWKA